MTGLWVAVACAGAGGCSFCLASEVFERAGRARARAQARRLTLDDVLQDRVMSFALFAAVACVVLVSVSVWLLPGALALASVLARAAPGYMQRRRERAVREACDQQLDVMADTLAFAVRSGLAFDAALELYCSRFDGELPQQMRSALTQWRSGVASREQALEGVAQRVGSKQLARFADTVVQAVEFGSPLSGMLEQLARDVRLQRHDEIERRVEKAPVKMLIPMGTCILPAMLILVMGPVLLQFAATGF